MLAKKMHLERRVTIKPIFMISLTLLEVVMTSYVNIQPLNKTDVDEQLNLT